MITLRSLAAPAEQASVDGSVNASGSMTAHVLTAASVGGGLATIVEWGLQTFGHFPNLPSQVDDAIAAICILVASMILRRIGS